MTHTIAKAVLHGFFTRNLPFFRTPKRAKGSTFWYALQAAREEGILAVALLLAVHGVIAAQGTDSPDMLFWVVVLLIQSIPYLAAVILSFIAAGAHVGARLIDGITEPLAAETDKKAEGGACVPLQRQSTHKV